MVQTPYSRKRKKIKKSKNQKKRKNVEHGVLWLNRKIQKTVISVIYVRACAREKAKNAEKGCFLCRCYAIKYRNIAFKPIFSPVERFLYAGWTIYPLCLRKRLKTL